MDLDKELKKVLGNIKSNNKDFLQEIDDEINRVENEDLYTIMNSVNKVLEAPARYNEIQGVDVSVNVNDECVIIKGITKHDVKANHKEFNQEDDADTSRQYTSAIVDEFIADVKKNIVPKGFSTKVEKLDDTLPGMGKQQFIMTICRK